MYGHLIRDRQLTFGYVSDLDLDEQVDNVVVGNEKSYGRGAEVVLRLKAGLAAKRRWRYYTQAMRINNFIVALF